MNTNLNIKFFALWVTLFWSCLTVVGQSTIKLGANPLIKNKNAALEIESTSQGLLLPRVTQLQMNAISANHSSTNPIPSGLVVFCTDCNANGQMYVFNANVSPAAWSGLGSSLINVPILSNISKYYTYTSATAFSLKATVENNGQNSTSIDAVTLPSIGFVYKDYLGPTTTIPDKNNDNVAVGTTRTTIGTPYTTSFAGMSNTKSYFFRPYAISGGGAGYGTPFVYSIAPPTFASSGTTDLTSTQVSKVSVDMTLLAGIPFNSAKFSYGTTAAATDNINQVLAETPSIDNSTNQATVTLKASIPPVVAAKKIFVKFTATTNGYDTSSTAEYSFTPTAELTSGGSAVISSIQPVSSSSLPNFAVGVPVGAGVTLPVSITASLGGTYNIFFVDNGLTFSGSGTLVSNSATTASLAITGTPNRYGTITIDSGTGLTATSLVTSELPLTVSGNADCGSTKGTVVVDIISPVTAKIWMDRNLGASRAGLKTAGATTATLATQGTVNGYDDIYAYGCYFQFGRAYDSHANALHVSTTSASFPFATTTILSSELVVGNSLFIVNPNSPYDWYSGTNTGRWDSHTKINNPCPGGYRIPTVVEFSNEIYNNSSTTAYSNLLITGTGGYRLGSDGLLKDTRSFYSTSSSTTAMYAYLNVFFTTARLPTSGLAVRCIKEY